MNEEKYKKTFEEIVRNLDKMENECIPSVSLSGREVSGHVGDPCLHGYLIGKHTLPCSEVLRFGPPVGQKQL